MQDELLRKSRKKRYRKIAIALVLIIFSATAAITLRLRSTSESTGSVTDRGGGRASISILCKELTGNFSKLLILADPTYVGYHNASIEYMKTMSTGETLKVAVRASKNGTLFVRSIYLISPEDIQKFLQHGRLKALTKQSH